MNKYIVTLTEEERELLSALVSKGEHKTQKILNALILLCCDACDFQTNRSTNEEIAKVLNISMKKIDRVKKRFGEEGFKPWQQKGWLSPPEHNGSFVANMEKVLDVYK